MSKANSTVVPIDRVVSLRKLVEDALASAIVSGEMAPGELFSAPTLAQRFQVSTTPVREAMLNLEKRGLVEAVRNKGFRVTRMSAEELQDIVDVRLMLEPAAMKRLAGSIARDELPALRASAGDIVAGAERGDLGAYLVADAAFHNALTAMLGNDRLAEIVADLRAKTRLPGLASMLASEELRVSALEHHELLELLEAGKGDEAEALMRRHIGHAVGWWAGRPESEVG